jgi:hypothetical protein
MLVGRSQLNENLQGDFIILQQISALRRENRLLKVGLVFCLVLSAMPYLTGFQPETISAKKVVTERIEFVRGEKTMMSIVAHPKRDGLLIQDKNNLPAVWISRNQYGGIIGLYGRRDKIVASITSQDNGGVLAAFNKDGKPVTLVAATPYGGLISLLDDKKHERISIVVTSLGGVIRIKDFLGEILWSVP